MKRKKKHSRSFCAIQYKLEGVRIPSLHVLDKPVRAGIVTEYRSLMIFH